ncbi:tetratricopeptide repeat protein [Pseudoflavitalea sp. X16]|uniref:tetratricopeptide repeat protein n=1 Tax=Paraflavitalea devenefica TaxID=2716334 RepID=UPI00141EB6E3|nr:tetratricopeptide repeat protein [Paraflavitalea devenefica]NII24139.1 tetratricopeptide repeat protein [Paraflavitalea devenefica]
MSKHLFIFIGLGAFAVVAQAQTENKAIRSGNKLYKEGKYDKALPEYEKAATQNPANPVSHYNLGNAQFRKEDFTASEKNFDTAVSTATTNELKQKSTYNKGVSLSKQKKLQESIDAYKKALRLNPNDKDTRYNLEKALSELKKQNEQKEQQQPKQNQQQKKQQQKQQPKPKQTLDKKKIEQFLKSLEQKEQEVQRKMQQNRTRATTQPEKDW